MLVILREDAEYDLRFTNSLMWRDFAVEEGETETDVERKRHHMRLPPHLRRSDHNLVMQVQVRAFEMLPISMLIIIIFWMPWRCMIACVALSAL